MSTLSVSCKMVLFHIRCIHMIEWKQNIDCKLASLSDTLEKCTGVNEAIVSMQNPFYFKFVFVFVLQVKPTMACINLI